MNKEENNDHYIGAFLEDIQSTVHRMAEALASLSEKVDRMDIRLKKVEKDTKLIPVIIAAISGHSQLKDQERRTKQLEKAR